MDKYRVIWDTELNSAKVLNGKYSLDIIAKAKQIDFCKVSFHFNMDPTDESNMWITSRDFNEYDKEIQDLTLNPKLQYVEVGAGLGGFVQNFIDTCKDKYVRPIVIEPADYAKMRSMLDYSLKLETSQPIKKKIIELIRRCDTMLDPKKVLLVNMSLEDAIYRDNELKGIADVVIENAGPSHYSKNGHEQVWTMEKRLLKTTGKLVATVVKSGGIFYPRN